MNTNLPLIQENALDLEASVVAQCDALINIIQERKSVLIQAIAQEVSAKSEKVREDISRCEKRLKSISSLSQYASEALKETDAASFMLVSLYAGISGVRCTDVATRTV